MINAQAFVKVIQHITFGLLLRTFDSYGDVNFGLHAFTTNNYLIGCLILSPYLFHFNFMSFIIHIDFILSPIDTPTKTACSLASIIRLSSTLET